MFSFISQIEATVFGTRPTSATHRMHGSATLPALPSPPAAEPAPCSAAAGWSVIDPYDEPRAGLSAVATWAERGILECINYYLKMRARISRSRRREGRRVRCARISFIVHTIESRICVDGGVPRRSPGPRFGPGCHKATTHCLSKSIIHPVARRTLAAHTLERAAASPPAS